MKLHKIKGVDKEICSAEQKIAYNMAFADLDAIRRVIKEYGEATAVHYSCKLRDGHISVLKDQGCNYNLDAVFCAYNAGILDYCKGKSHIFTSYAEIGKCFPILY